MPFDGEISWTSRLAPLIERWKTYLRLHPHAHATMDFETRSACNLRKHGSWLYAKHPTTQAMCLAYKLPGYDEPELWHMAHPDQLISQSPDPEDLFAFILAGGLVEAHNSFFERVIWYHVMVMRHGWPEIAHEQWRCSASKASAASLPRDLDGATEAMRLSHQKDKRGKYLINKLCKPRKPRKAEVQAWTQRHALEDEVPEMPLLWNEDEEDLADFWEYCRQDVRAEEEFSATVRDLNENELAIWQMDQWMNWRGVRFDLELAEKALRIAKEWRRRLNQELERMTGVSSATKRQAVKDWLKENERLELPDTRADTLDHYLESEPISGRAKRIIEIVKQVNRTSVRKYQAMLDRVDPEDGRARDLLMYHGAGTGRWTGKGVQVQNFPRGNTVNTWFLIDGKEYSKLDMDFLCECILTEDVDWVQAFHGDVMEALSSALRGAVIATDGYDLMAADYSAIEARCVLWLAGAEKALDVFRRGDDIYCDMATGIYGYEVRKKTHPEERQFGKQAILGLGYGMGYVTFFLTCRKYGIKFSRQQCLRIMGAQELEKYEGQVRKALDPEMGLHDEPGKVTVVDPTKLKHHRLQAKKTRRRLIEARENPDAVTHELALMKYTVNVYRTRYPEVKEMWKDQELSVLRAIQSPGERVKAGKVTWYMDGDFLYGELPSERCLSYADAHVKPVQTSWGEVKPAARYMSVVTGNKWARTATYGGKLVENITQAVARDIMTCAMLETYRKSVLDREGVAYLPAMSVHDELVCEVRRGEGSTEEFEGIMSSVLPWADGCPIVAEAERFRRYRK